MLCYLSSRNTNDVLHDTFSWIGMYRRSFLVLWPLALVNALLLAWGGVDVSHFQLSAFARIQLALMPFAHLDEGGGEDRKILVYCVTAMLTALCIAPMLVRYYIDHRSLRRLTLTDCLRDIARYPRAAVFGALATGAFVYSLTIHSIMLVILLVVMLLWLIPAVIMGRMTEGLRIGERWWLYLRGVFFILLLFLIIQGLPVLCLELIELCMYLLNSVLPGAVGTAIHLSLLVQMGLGILIGVAYTMAVAFLLVASLMLHGAIYDEKIKDKK